MSQSSAIRRLLLQGEPLSAREIGRKLGISQSTVSRTLRGELFEETQSIGAGRGSLYGLRHVIGKHGYCWPVYQIDELGRRVFLGNLTSLAGENWLIQLEESVPRLYSRHLANGLSEGWPWFLDGLRPQGFMGGAFAKQYHHILKLF